MHASPQSADVIWVKKWTALLTPQAPFTKPNSAKERLLMKIWGVKRKRITQSENRTTSTAKTVKPAGNYRLFGKNHRYRGRVDRAKPDLH